MSLTRFTLHFWSVKFAPVALFSLFLFTNITGFFYSPAIAPSVQAMPVAKVVAQDYIPADIPSSGDRELDLVILRAGEKYGVDPRFIHAVIWQESKYKVKARSGAGAQG